MIANPYFLIFPLLVLASLAFLSMRLFAKPFAKVQSGNGLVLPEPFRRADLIFVLMLCGWFLASVFAGFLADQDKLQNSNIVEGAILFVVLITAILLFTHLRGVTEGFGFFRMRPGGVLTNGVLYLLAAYPLIFCAILLTLIFQGDSTEGQPIVQFFLENKDGGSRFFIILLAVILAPVSEELIFRGYIYGVLKKFGGFWFSIVVTSLLFALIHLHIPSIGVLAVLSVCLTLAYEATGSIFVPMLMHSLFNAISVTVMLSLPDLVP